MPTDSNPLPQALLLDDMAKTATPPSDDYHPIPVLDVEEEEGETRSRSEHDTDADDSRIYLEIRPSNEALHPGAVAQAMRLLFDVLENITRRGYLNLVRRKARFPRVEWLLVSDGRPDPTIRYLVSADYLELLEDLEGVLRTCYPNTYEFAFVEFHPEQVVSSIKYDPVAIAERDFDDRDGPQHPSIVPGHPYFAGVEYRGRSKYRRDWQTPLQSFDSVVDPGRGYDRSSLSSRIPLASVIEAMRDAEVPVIYEVVIRPLPDWSNRADAYIHALQTGRIGFWRRFWDFVSTPSKEDLDAYQPPMADAERIRGIEHRNPRWSFALAARAVALTYEKPSRADAVARRLSNVLGHLSGPTHKIRGLVKTDDELHPGTPLGRQIFEDICTMAAPYVEYEFRRNLLPWRAYESEGIVVTAEELPGFCLVDGSGLTPNGRRALAARHGERTGLSLPTPDQLERYGSMGQAVGMPLTHDHQPLGRPLAIPPEDQDRHSIVIGPTGAGKTILMLTAMLTNVESTSGPEILFDHKGGGTSIEYLQMHFKKFGNLDDVYYFDCTRVLPAISVLDIEPLLNVGVPHEEARSRITGHHEEILASLVGPDRYFSAVEVPKVIRNHLRAEFDLVHGSTRSTNTALYQSIQRTLREEEPPSVSDDGLAEYFASLVERDRDVFNKILGGALNRVERIATDGRLAPMFDHLPDPGDPHFDFTQIIDEDAVVIFDFGGMESGAKRAITLALLSTLWRALHARALSCKPKTERPLVNCYLEEAGSVADSSIMDLLLSQGRSFGLSIMLGVQFLGQLDSRDSASNTAEEAINETATIITGQVAVRDDLVDALATDDMPPAAVDRRLSRMPRGEWLVRPGTDFGAESVRPFLVRSLPVPGGHPASQSPLSRQEQAAFDATFEIVTRQTADRHGLPHLQNSHPIPFANEDESESETPVKKFPRVGRVDSALPYTLRLPGPTYYLKDTHAVQCLYCESRYDPNVDGMVRALECCGSIEHIDIDDFPICDVNLKRSPGEREETGCSDVQLMFTQAVYNAIECRYHPIEYDIVWDSMIRLQEYLGIAPEEVTDLISRGLLRHDTDHPHRLYSVTPEGRDAIGESYREGLDFGDGRGDLGESAVHVVGREVGSRYLDQMYVADPEHDAIEVAPYHALDGGHRLDIAALDVNGNVVVAVEVERINHDWREAIPSDFDKIAACQPQEAIWIVPTRQDAHRVLEALHEPAHGKPRIDRTYAPTTSPQFYRIDSPGLTAVYTIGYLRDSLTDDRLATLG